MDEQEAEEEEEEEVKATPKKGACERTRLDSRARATGRAAKRRAPARPLTLPPCPTNPWRAGKKAKAKAKAKGKKAETPETSSRAHWTEEEETALSKYHDRLTKTWNKKEVPDWDAIVRKMIVRRPERAARARKRPAPRSPPPLLVASPRAARPPARVRARAPRAGRRLPGPLDHRGARALHQHVRGRGRLRAARRAAARWRAGRRCSCICTDARCETQEGRKA